MRVLVTGGQFYSNRAHLHRVLDAIHETAPIDELLCGGARGADTLAYHWALAREITVIIVPAKWTKYRRSAGVIRNQHMLDRWGCDLCVAFHGANGTADMIARALRAGVRVMDRRDEH